MRQVRFKNQRSLFSTHGISQAATYEAIVVSDTTHTGIDSVTVRWTFPDTSYVTRTDDQGKTSVNYSGSTGNTTVSVTKMDWHPVRPPSGTIYGTTSQYRYEFTMLPDYRNRLRH